jgi:hypothetical protein
VPSAEPAADHTAVAADVQGPVAVAPGPFPGEAGADFSTYEPIGDGAPADAGADLSTYEPIDGRAPAEPDANLSTYEPIADRAPDATGANHSTYEPIADRAPVEAGANHSTYEPIADRAQAEAGASFSTYEPIGDPAQAEAGANFSTYEPIADRAPAEAGAGFRALEAILDEIGDGADLEIDSPQYVRMREACRQIGAAIDAGRRREDDPAPGVAPDPQRRDSPLARAEERLRLRQEELSRQLDERYGINGQRPKPAGEFADPDGAGGSHRPEWEDSS